MCADGMRRDMCRWDATDHSSRSVPLCLFYQESFRLLHVCMCNSNELVRRCLSMVPHSVDNELNALSPHPRVGAVIPTVSVIIPTLNEAANLPHVFARIPPWVYEVVV